MSAQLSSNNGKGNEKYKEIVPASVYHVTNTYLLIAIHRTLVNGCHHLPISQDRKRIPDHIPRNIELVFFGGIKCFFDASN